MQEQHAYKSPKPIGNYTGRHAALFPKQNNINMKRGKKKKRGKKGAKKRKKEARRESMGHSSFNYSVVGLKYLMEMSF